jgi:hypothetical protein
LVGFLDPTSKIAAPMTDAMIGAMMTIVTEPSKL